MSDQLTQEKNLLIMKGEALRMKLRAQANHTGRNIARPIGLIKRLGSAFSLSTPLLRTALPALVGRNSNILTKRNLAYSALALTSLYLFNSKNKDNQT